MSSKDADEFIADFSRFYMLLLLYEGPRHGYSIISLYKERTGKEISPSLVYPFLQELEKRGLVEYSIEPVGEKEKKVYALTREGKKLCRQLFKRFAHLVSTAIEPSLEICANCGCKLYEGGYTEEIGGKRLTFCCEHCAKSYKDEKDGH
jgi:DNA-binding PadR family transcriptional regulator